MKRSQFKRTPRPSGSRAQTPRPTTFASKNFFSKTSSFKGVNKPINKPFNKVAKKPSTPRNPTAPENTYPMRINKYLAQKGYATRREADELIQKKFVTINGKFAVLGDKIAATDIIEVRGNKKNESYVYFAHNKPRGVATDKISLEKQRDVFPVVNLDPNADGLVILTNDRRIIDRLQNTKHAHIKEYVIHTVHPLRANFKEKMEQGVVLGAAAKVEGSKTEPITCTILEKTEKLFSLRTTDNGSHIRQMCSLFGAEIESLTRTKISNIDLGSLPANSSRPILGDELASFLKNLGL